MPPGTIHKHSIFKCQLNNSFAPTFNPRAARIITADMLSVPKQSHLGCDLEEKTLPLWTITTLPFENCKNIALVKCHVQLECSKKGRMANKEMFILEVFKYKFEMIWCIWQRLDFKFSSCGEFLYSLMFSYFNDTCITACKGFLWLQLCACPAQRTYQKCHYILGVVQDPGPEINNTEKPILERWELAITKGYSKAFSGEEGDLLTNQLLNSWRFEWGQI
jgi:hypothetical protein